MTPQDTLSAIQNYAELGKKQRRQPLSREEKTELAMLDSLLRDMLQGTRPAPKAIANPRAARETSSVADRPAPRAPAPQTFDLVDEEPDPNAATLDTPPMPSGLSEDLVLSPAAPSTPPTPAAPARPKKKPMSLEDMVQKLPDADRSKLGEISLKGMTSGGYTPPARPAYMDDYYSSDLEPVHVTADLEPATSVVTADGSTADLAKEVRIMFGLEKGPPASAQGGSSAARRASQIRRRPSSVAVGPAPAAKSSPPAKGIPVIVHLLEGGTTRGRLRSFDPEGDVVSVFTKSAPDPVAITLSKVLVIFFGGTLDGVPTPDAGTSLAVRLTNDRQITGVSPDYVEGADSLRLVPETKRGNIDHIWVPAWAVKGVELR